MILSLWCFVFFWFCSYVFLFWAVYAILSNPCIFFGGHVVFYPRFTAFSHIQLPICVICPPPHLPLLLFHISFFSPNFQSFVFFKQRTNCTQIGASRSFSTTSHPLSSSLSPVWHTLPYAPPIPNVYSDDVAGWNKHIQRRFRCHLLFTYIECHKSNSQWLWVLDSSMISATGAVCGW